MGWFDNFSWGDALGAAATVASAVVPAIINSNANERAAEKVAAGYQTQADVIAAGNAAAQKRHEEVKELTAPAITRMREITAADTSRLDEREQRIREDQLRNGVATLKAHGLGGAGRAGVAALQSADNTLVQDMLTQKESRSDQAARSLSSYGLNSYGHQAALDSATGRAAGGAALGGAINEAQADATNAGNWGAATGTAMAALQGIISDENKRKGRQSRYSSSESREIV